MKTRTAPIIRDLVLDVAHPSPNPIKAWLARVAVECGTPLAMEVEATFVKNENTRKLIVEYALMWARKLELRKRA